MQMTELSKRKMTKALDVDNGIHVCVCLCLNTCAYLGTFFVYETMTKGDVCSVALLQ